MPSTTNNGTAVVTLKPSDFTDPTMYKVNNLFNDLYAKLTALYAPGQQTTLGAILTVPNILASGQNTVPDDGDTLITLTIAKMLFGASTTRQALATGTAANITEIVQPITGGGTGGGTTPTTASIVVQDQTLSANTTISAPNPASVGQILAFFIRQDGTGGWVTAWTSPPFRGATSSAHSGQIGLGVLPNTWSLILFVSQIDPADSILKWWKACLVTNQT